MSKRPSSASPANPMQDDPRAYWNDDAGPKWVASQNLVDRMLAPVSASIIEAAELLGGEHVLDIGCGSGSLSVAAAERVAPTGRVTGVDVSKPLVEHARQRTAGHAIEALLADAEEADLPPADVAVSRFGVMFFRDTTRAFENLGRALRPGGRAIFACWQAVDRNPWMTWPLAAVGDLVPEDLPLGPPPGADVPGPFRFADASRPKEALAASGFELVEVRSHTQELELRGTPDELLEMTLRIGPLSRVLDALGPSDRVDALERVTSRLAQLHDGSAIRLDSAWWVLVAR